LHCAAENGRKEIVEMLINANADVNERSNNGYTALYFATDNGHTEIVEMLISAGSELE
jgi:ankyrin repeat protein